MNGPAWLGFAGNAQHTALSGGAAQTLGHIVWQKYVDLDPPYSGSDLFIHYGSPVITDQNTVVLPIKTDARGVFRIEARSGGNGALIWSYDSDYQLPPFGWYPSYNLSLAAAASDGSAPARLYAAGGGGKLLMRDAPDAPDGTMQTAVFYGADIYATAATQFNATVSINTPITVDSQRNAFFGFQVTGANPAGLVSGIARVGAGGSGIWLAASDAAGDAAIDKVATNSAPALSADEQTLYVAVKALDNLAVGQAGVPARARHPDAGDQGERAAHRSRHRSARGDHRRLHRVTDGRTRRRRLLRRPGEHGPQQPRMDVALRFHARDSGSSPARSAGTTPRRSFRRRWSPRTPAARPI